MNYCLSCLKYLVECYPSPKDWDKECSRFEEAQLQNPLSLEPDAENSPEN